MTSNTADRTFRFKLKPTRPIGYSKLPDGVRCRCIKLWQDAKGAFYCCRSSTPSPAQPDIDVRELVTKMRGLRAYLWEEQAVFTDQAATTLETLEARVKVLETLLRRIEPHIDAIVCYASTMDEYEPNRLAVDLRAALLKQLSGDGE